MTHHGEGLYPILGGGFELQLSFLCSHSPQPAQLGQETTYTWRAGNRGYSKAGSSFWQVWYSPGEELLQRDERHGSFVRYADKGTGFLDNTFILIQVLEKIFHSFIWQDGYLYFESILKTFGSKHVLKTFVMRYVTRHRYYGVVRYYGTVSDTAESITSYRGGQWEKNKGA